MVAATKAGRHWGREGAINLCRQRHNAFGFMWIGDAAGGSSAFASTYYAAAHYALRQIHFRLDVARWIVRFLWDLHQAKYWIEGYERLVGFEEMSAGALDIYAAIAEMMGDLWRRVSGKRAGMYYGAAIHATATAKVRGNLSEDDRALNLIRRAGLLIRIETGEGRQMESASRLIAEAFAMLPRLTPLTVVRVMRAYGEYFEEIGNFSQAEAHLSAAKILAEKEGLRDQVGKISSLLTRVAKKRRGRTSWF